MTGYARAAFVTASLAAALAVASCSDGADAEPTPTTSAGSSSTTSSGAGTSPSTTASTSTSSSTATANVPTAARAHTEEGAKAFAEFYFAEASKGAMSGSSSALRRLSAASCMGCTSFIKLIDGYAASGQHVDRDALRVTDTNVRPGGAKNEVGVDVLATDGPKALVDAKGNRIQTFTKSKLFFETTVRWSVAGWQMKSLKAVR